LKLVETPLTALWWAVISFYVLGIEQ